MPVHQDGIKDLEETRMVIPFSADTTSIFANH